MGLILFSGTVVKFPICIAPNFTDLLQNKISYWFQIIIFVLVLRNVNARKFASETTDTPAMEVNFDSANICPTTRTRTITITKGQNSVFLNYFQGFGWMFFHAKIIKEIKEEVKRKIKNGHLTGQAPPAQLSSPSTPLPSRLSVNLKGLICFIASLYCSSVIASYGACLKPCSE